MGDDKEESKRESVVGVFAGISKVVLFTAAVFAVGGGAIAVVAATNSTQAPETAVVDSVTSVPPAPVVEPAPKPEPVTAVKPSKKPSAPKVEQMPNVIPDEDSSVTDETDEAKADHKPAPKPAPKPKHEDGEENVQDEEPATIPVTYDDDDDHESEHHESDDDDDSHEGDDD